MYARIYNSTRSSLLFVTLFHAASNTVGTLVGDENPVITYFVAAALVVACGARHLSCQGDRRVQQDASAIVVEGG